MGVVHEAFDDKLKRAVALKVMARAAAVDPAAEGRFRREAQALAALRHRGVVTVHDSGEWHGQLYLVMALVEGEDLGARLDGHMLLDPVEATALLGQVAAALDAVHAAHLVHRDIKPSNILLEGAERRPLLCDFGLARQADGSNALTATGLPIGTVLYMSPEQLRGQGVTAASDVYAYGCVVFHCLTGRPPFVGQDAHRVATAHCDAPVPSVRALRPELPVAVQDVLERCLAKQPEQRWPSAGAAARALRQAVDSAPHGRRIDPTLPVPVQADPGPARYLPRALVAACASVVVAAAIGGGLLGMQSAAGPGPEPIGGGTVAAGATIDDAQQALGGLLSEGYGECTPLPTSAGQTAKLNCDRTPDGIATLHIAQWAGAQAMREVYREKYVSRYPAKPCKDFSGGAGARGTGHVSSRADVGGLACFVNANEDAVLLWQVDGRALQLLAIRDDADSLALFRWWESNRDAVLRPQ
jgi:serine/threonine-protein kinase